MAIEQTFKDLINAAIDGELSAPEQAELDAFLESSEEGRALYDEFSSLCGALDALESEEPPAHLKHVIMSNVPKQSGPVGEPHPLQSLLAFSPLRYAGTFAAGVLVALVIFDSTRVSDHVFDDVTGLVGTVAEPVDVGHPSSISVDELDVAGTVSLRSSGSLMILDFDLVSKEHIEIEADYGDPGIWFNAFAQLESEDTTVAAANGRVRLGMRGKRRYAIYLHNRGGHEARINLRFLTGGEVVHEATLEYTPAD